MQETEMVADALGLILKGVRSASSLESQWLDFKTDKSSDKETYQDLAEAAVCFANASGGAIVLGVSDSRVGPEAFLGTQLKVDVLRSRIHSLTEPSLVVTVREILYADARLLAITVPEGLDVHSTRKGLVTRRWNDECLPMRPIDVSRLDDERRGADWTSQSSGRPLGDADPDALLRVRSFLRTTQDESRRTLGLASEPDILAGLRLVHSDGTLTRAGEILLCRDARATADDILVYQFRQTPGGEALVARRWGTPMILAFTEAMDALSARIGTTPVNTSAGQQLQIEDYPLAAVREALANALLHGDYRERRPVQIEHSPDSLSIRSPGPLVAGITPNNILTAGSRARFPLLAGACRTLGLAEELGQGMDRMFREMVRAGRSTPTVAVEHESVDPATVVTLAGGPPNTRISRFVAELPESERNDTDTLLIVLLLCQRKSVTARDVAPVVQRGVSATESILRRLSSGEAQLLEPSAGTANRAHPNYRLRSAVLVALGPAVSYHRRSSSEVDRKVIDHVREYGTINSATIQRIFDVDVYRSRDILRDFVGREILVRISEQTRGPKVKYGPGAQFPVQKRRAR
ncbi:putative DNA binding domain-containing protein [Couchioplanes caeruleus]|uniref:RNA-binding domain-containing protein n=1 Tax=Couchioplanes caeruleus TaxID=56438 RepID=UPI0020BF32F0|nr:RNA-binding domain-containing protein [Couchioplanes caeruleus]UQU65645.1 putative DNA binding domain-containing protein [Couchioplanes caeruleus]